MLTRSNNYIFSVPEGADFFVFEKLLILFSKKSSTFAFLASYLMKTLDKNKNFLMFFQFLRQNGFHFFGI